MLHAHRSHKRLQEARQPRAHPATPRRVPRERAPLPREQARAPRPLPALEPALAARGRSAARVEARQWPLQAHAKRRGNIVGRMFPTLVGGRSTAVLVRGRGGDQAAARGRQRASPGPGGAWPTLPRPADVGAGHVGADRHRLAAAGVGPARSSGRRRSLVGRRPVAAPRRQPPARDPGGGGPASRRRSAARGAPGHRPGRDRLPRPGRREARLTATRLPDGPVTLVLVQDPGAAGDDLLGQATPRTAPGLIRAWTRRRGMAPSCRTRTQLWATEACQGPGEEASDGPLGWRLGAGLVRFSTTPVRCSGRVTRAESVVSLTHHGRFLTSQDLA